MKPCSPPSRETPQGNDSILKYGAGTYHTSGMIQLKAHFEATVNSQVFLLEQACNSEQVKPSDLSTSLFLPLYTSSLNFPQIKILNMHVLSNMGITIISRNKEDTTNYCFKRIISKWNNSENFRLLVKNFK